MHFCTRKILVSNTEYLKIIEARIAVIFSMESSFYIRNLILREKSFLTF